MGNKTIYVKDEALWDRAKALAGKDGLSSLIAKALADYVASREQGFERYRFSVLGDQRIAFDGKQVAAYPGDRNVPAFRVFMTRAGKLVVLEDSGPPNGHYGVYDSVAELRDDELVYQILESTDRAAFLDDLGKRVGQDDTRWIE